MPRPDRLAPLLALFPAPVARVIRYGFVGGGISLLYSALVIALVSLPIDVEPTVASVIAFACTLPVAWYAHASLSFADRPFDRFQPARFAVSTIASFVTAVAGMYWITAVAHQSYLLGILWNWLIIPVTNFLVYLLWVFRRTSTTGGRA